jgi:hypothetical protein
MCSKKAKICFNAFKATYTYSLLINIICIGVILSILMILIITNYLLISHKVLKVIGPDTSDLLFIALSVFAYVFVDCIVIVILCFCAALCINWFTACVENMMVDMSRYRRELARLNNVDTSA